MNQLVFRDNTPPTPRAASSYFRSAVGCIRPQAIDSACKSSRESPSQAIGDETGDEPTAEEKRSHRAVFLDQGSEVLFNQTVGHFVRSKIQAAAQNSFVAFPQFLAAFANGNTVHSKNLFYKELRNQLVRHFPFAEYDTFRDARGYFGISLI